MVCCYLKVHQTNTLGNRKSEERSLVVQVWHFLLHLRWHYQLFILPGGFLLGGVLSPDFDLNSFIVQFLNVHLLLFGGATAYNSYWDKDEGPIGGLRNPPPMDEWMWPGAVFLQLTGLILAIPQGSIYVSVFALSMLFFWLYSTPLARWKSRPLKSLVAIGMSTGFNAVLLGYLATGHASLNIFIFIAALGVALMLLSLYPFSQIYQRDEDLRRGDQTFALQYGQSAVNRFFEIAFFTGLILVTIAILSSHIWLAIFFGLIGITTGLLVRTKLLGLSAKEEDYTKVMRIKYATSMAFVAFLVLVLILKHSSLSEISPFVDLLLK